MRIKAENIDRIHKINGPKFILLNPVNPVENLGFDLAGFAGS